MIQQTSTLTITVLQKNMDASRYRSDATDPMRLRVRAPRRHVPVRFSLLILIRSIYAHMYRRHIM